MRTDELKKTILKLFRDKELYGYEVNKMLSLQGTNVELSRLYRVLNDMRNEGLLNERWERSSLGPRKKMYSVSEKGREELNEILLEAINTVHRFYGEYIMRLSPEIDFFGETLTWLAGGLEGHEKIAYLTTKYFGIHEVIISILKEKIPEGKIFIITPDTMEINVNIENVFVDAGNYVDIPFKNHFVDRLIVIDLPKKEALQKAIKEWKRVVNEGGRLSIFTPTILIKKQEDPMPIGDFVEKYEHQIIEKAEPIDRDILIPTLEGQFEKVVEKEAVHMSVISASEPKIDS